MKCGQQEKKIGDHKVNHRQFKPSILNSKLQEKEVPKQGKKLPDKTNNSEMG